MATRIQHLLGGASALFLVAGCETFVLDPPSQAAIAEDSGDVVDPSEIVVLADSSSEADALISQSRSRGYDLKSREWLKALGLVQVVLTIPDNRTGGQAIGELERLVPGVTAGVNHAYRPQTTAQPREFAREIMSWPQSGCQLRSSVGVVDSGGGTIPPGVAAKRFTERSALDISHGAEVATLIIETAAPGEGRVLLADVVGETVDGEPAAGVDDVLRGVAWLLEEGVQIINISLAGPYNKILDRGLQRAADRGAIVVAAAGNDGAHARPRYPAALRDVIAVTAVDANLEPYQNAVRGQHIDVAAPGVDVFVGYEGGTYRTGTSFSAPFVTTFFAVHAEPPAHVSAAREVLEKSARDLGAPGRDHVFGFGALNVGASC